jgi:8-amino-7-oxononanoate synthase
MLFSAGFLANSGVIPNICSRGDYMFYDERVHASIMEGRLITIASTQKYKHNDMADLERVLAKVPLEASKLVVTDGVFSMEGDVCKLPDIVDLAHKYNASIMVDEAHGIGVFGEGGRGVCDHFGLRDEVDLIMGTFSKSIASLGGFIATSNVITNYLRHHSRSYIFTASITPASTAAAMKAIDILINEPERQEHLWKITHEALQGFRDMGCEIGHTETPIIPLFIRDNNKTFAITRDLLNEGIFVNPVVSPAVAPNDTLIRFSLMATHTHEQVAFALEKIQKVFRAYGLIP